MSVTFTFAHLDNHPEHGLVVVHGSTCDHVCPTPATCEDAAMWGERSCDHADAARELHGCRAHDVNVSNVNAIAILERLGLDVDSGDLYGTIDPDDLLGRALVGNVGRDDTGTASSEYRMSPDTCLVVEGAVRPGYYAEALDRLAALATEAKARGVLVGFA